MPSSAARWSATAGFAIMLAGCTSQTIATGPGPDDLRHFDPLLGVFASPRVVADGEPVPRGGGSYLVGRPYTIGGRVYVPNASPQGYTVVGTASWYGGAFHGRRTANGEIFDKGSISAAHPTLPLPSLVRVTNLKNGRSIIVRVNDRGPYHGGRVMDVSQRVAEALAFRDEGTARIRVDYLGRAGVGGSNDGQLLATLRTDGGPAEMGGATGQVMAASADPVPPGPTLPLDPRPRPMFRRNHIAERSEREEMPVEGLSAPQPLVLPVAPRVAASRPGRAPLRRFGPAPDPFYRPLFPAQRLGPKPSISFAPPPRPKDPAAGDAGL